MPFSSDAIEAGRLLFAQQCEFLRGAAAIADLPPPDLPELAFVGRSNVGKSSLLNALTGRKTLARVSKTPGRTRQINFFRLGGRLLLADLPGYGYARVSKTESARWTELIFAYLRGRPNLRRAVVLIDARHGPRPNDLDVMELLDRAAVSYQLVLTKSDSLKPKECTEIQSQTAMESRNHPAAYPEIMAVSAVSGQGIPELRAELASLAAA